MFPHPSMIIIINHYYLYYIMLLRHPYHSLPLPYYFIICLMKLIYLLCATATPQVHSRKRSLTTLPSVCINIHIITTHHLFISDTISITIYSFTRPSYTLHNVLWLYQFDTHIWLMLSMSLCLLVGTPFLIICMYPLVYGVHH